MLLLLALSALSLAESIVIVADETSYELLKSLLVAYVKAVSEPTVVRNSLIAAVVVFMMSVTDFSTSVKCVLASEVTGC